MSNQQLEFFGKPIFEARSATENYDFDRFRSGVKRFMSNVIRDCEIDRHDLSSEIARLTGTGFSKTTLDALTAESKVNHNIRLDQFKAFIIATGAIQGWDMVVSDEGLLVIKGNEARLAEIAYWQEEQKKIAQKIKGLRATRTIIDRETK